MQVQTTKHARPLCASHDNSQSLRCRGQWFWWLVRAHSMAFEVSYNLENEQQFWDGERLACLRAAPPAVTPPVLTPRAELDDIVSTRCRDEESIDNSLRAFLNVTTSYRCTQSTTSIDRH